MNSLTQNPKTTIAAILGAVAWLLTKFGIVIPAEYHEHILAITVFVIGFWARDAKAKPTAQQPPPTGAPNEPPTARTEPLQRPTANATAY